MKKDKYDIPWDVLRAMIEETSKQWAESMRRHDEYTKKFEIIDAKHEKMLEKIEIAQKKWGSLDNNIGDHCEQYFQDALRESLTFGGEKYDYMDSNVTRNTKNGGAEFDIVLYNGKSVAIIETKHKIHQDFVEKMINEKVPQFRKYFKAFNKHKIYLGIAGFSWDKKVPKLASEYGIGIIKQAGKSIEVLADNLKAY